MRARTLKPLAILFLSCLLILTKKNVQAFIDGNGLILEGLANTRPPQPEVDYSKHGDNWQEDGCPAGLGTQQSPLNIDLSTLETNEKIKYEFNYTHPIFNATLSVDGEGSLIRSYYPNP